MRSIMRIFVQIIMRIPLCRFHYTNLTKQILPYVSLCRFLMIILFSYSNFYHMSFLFYHAFHDVRIIMHSIMCFIIRSIMLIIVCYIMYFIVRSIVCRFSIVQIIVYTIMCSIMRFIMCSIVCRFYYVDFYHGNSIMGILLYLVALLPVRCPLYANYCANYCVLYYANY